MKTVRLLAVSAALALAPGAIAASSSAAAGPTPIPAATYQGTLSSHGRRHAQVTLRTAGNARSVSAKLTCHGRPAPVLHKARVRRGRFSGAVRRHRRLAWSISGRFVSASRVLAKLKMPGACDGAAGKVVLNLRRAGGGGAGGAQRAPGRAGAAPGGAANAPAGSPTSNLSIQLDPSRAKSETIGSGGGSISVTDARGNLLQLTIPPNALPEAVSITMTPLASVAGSPLPAAGFAGGVDLQPDGLQLFKAATLTVVPAAPIPAPDTAAFTYSGGGQDFHLTVPGTDGSASFAIPVPHFTGYGAWNADNAAQEAANAQAAGTGEGQAQQELAAEVNAWRNGSLDEDGFKEAAAKILQRYYDSSIAPEIPAAMSDDAAAEKGIRDLLAFERTAGLLGVDTWVHPSEDEVLETVQEIVAAMIHRAEADCTESHHLAQVPRLLRLDRQYALAGGPEIPLDTLMRCWTFRLEFDSLIEEHAEDGGFLSYHLRASVPLKVDLAHGTVVDGSEGESYDASGEVPANCPETDQITLVSATPGTFEVPRVNLGIDPESARADPTQPVTELSILASPGSIPNGPPDETYSSTPCEGPAPPPFQFAGWLTLFDDFHAPEAQASSTILFSGFDPQSGAIVGRREYAQQHGTNSETTTITLVHTPPS